MAKADKNPSCTWFWKDYQDDLALRTVSLAAQGLWMRMLCLAALAQPAGFITLGSEPCTVDDLPGRLAPLVGIDKETAMILVAELRDAGVFSVARNRVAYSRRMMRARKLSEVRAEAGLKGAVVTNGNNRKKGDLPRQNSGKGGGKASASGTRLHSPISINPLNPPGDGEGDGTGDGGHAGAGPPAVIAGRDVGELRVKAGALIRGGEECQVIADNLGRHVLCEMVRHGILPPEVGERYGVRVPKAA